MKSSIFLFLSFLVLSSMAVANSHPDIVRITCENCSSSDPNVNFHLCMNSFNSVPESHRSNLRGLGIIATKLAKANATNIQSIVRKLLHPPPRDSYNKSCLETCLEVYSDSASRLNDSIGAIKAGRYDDANVWISAAVGAPGDCEQGFSDGNMKSPLTKEDSDFFGIAVIALAVVALLQGQAQ